MCRVAAIEFRDNPVARSSKMSFTLILLAIIFGLPSVKFEEYLIIYFTITIARTGGAIKRTGGSAGAKYSGIHREADWNNQGRCDSAIFAILAKDYNTI
jgi:hypothetical protein